MFTPEFFEFVTYWTTIALVIVLILAILFGLHEFIYVIWALTHRCHAIKSDKKFKYAVLIPARNESMVINGIFSSLQKQTYDHNYFDVYVIVEDITDPTVEIAKKYGYSYVVRTELENRRRKGYALDDGYQYIIKQNKKYDAFIIFDADNVVEPNYIEELNNLKGMGYEVGSGIRKSTNTNTNWISGTSTLLFAFIYCVDGKGKSKFIKKVNICGTGYFLNSTILEKEGGFVWHSLTEDVEFTKYCYANDINCGYNEDAVFYDEQPETMSQVRIQHTRWIGGFCSVANKYTKQIWHNIFHNKGRKFANYTYIIDITSLVFFVVGLFGYGVIMIVFGGLAIANKSWTWDWNWGLTDMALGFTSLVLLYVLMFLSSFIICVREYKTLQMKMSIALRSCLLFPLYFMDFIPAFFKSLKKKNKEWIAIEHKGKVNTKGAENVEKE